MLRLALFLALALSAVLLLTSTHLRAAQSQSPIPGDASTSRPGEQHPPTRDEVQMRRSQQRQLAKANYEQMKKDADQLLKLATELKHYVDTAGENTLSMDVLKKTDEIEKLSKDIRNKMKSDIPGVR